VEFHAVLSLPSKAKWAAAMLEDAWKIVFCQVTGLLSLRDFASSYEDSQHSQQSQQPQQKSSSSSAPAAAAADR
jgi:hypothetical protein